MTDEAPKTIDSKDDGKTFTVPESRIGNAAGAREIIGKLQAAEQTRSGRRAQVNGLLNGNKPWRQAVLDKAGQGERTNLNLREGEGFVAAAKSPYWDLVFEVPLFAQFTLDYGAEPMREQEWADKVAQRYHYALDDWDDMDSEFQRSQYQMVVHGAGPMVWEDGKDWQSASKMAGQILVPDDAPANPKKWETAAVPRSYLPSELWQKLKKIGDSKNTGGWNVLAVKQAIMKAAPEDTQKRFNQSWEFYEEEIRKGSASWDNKSKRIFAVNLYQKEFDGKISHFIVLQDGVNGTGTSAETADATTSKAADPMAGFLYRKLGRYECFSQIVNGFLYDVGPDGQWHSVKGAGPKIFDFCEVSNRLTCRAIDGVIASSGLIVKAQDTNALQETAVTTMTGGVVLNPKYDIQQNRMSTDMQSVLLMKRDMKNTLDGNTGQYRRRVADETPYPTLGQEQMDAAMQATLRGGDVNRYYRSLDRWHKETFRRMLAMGKYLYSSRKNLAPESDAGRAEGADKSRGLTPSEKGALKFYRSLVETDQVPEDVLEFENFCRIKATRSIGAGSAQMRQMIGKQLMEALPTMDERGRNVAQRMWASSWGGQTLADLIYPRFDSPQLNDDHMALATLENNALRMPGGQVAITPKQDHVIHFGVHMKDLSAHAQEVQGGQSDPMALMVHLDQAGPHLHEHLQKVAGDPTRKAQVQAMQKAWLEMSRMADQLRQHIEEAAAAKQQEQPEPQMDPEILIGLAKVHANAQVAQEKMMLDSARKDAKQAADLRRKDMSTAHGLRLQQMREMESAGV